MKLQTNQILLGDCLEILENIPDQSLDMVFTDPPFDILNKTNISTKFHTDIIQENIFDQFESYDHYISFIIKFVQIISKKMKENITFLCFFATQYVTDLIRICEQCGMVRKNVLIWKKNNPSIRIRKSNFVSCYESIVYMVKGYPPFHFTHHTDMYNCITIPIPSNTERVRKKQKKTKNESNSVHPTQKPLRLLKKLIIICSNPNDIICDPFAGMGSINKASLETGRYCLGIEKNIIYYNYAQDRLNSSLPKKIQKTLI